MRQNYLTPILVSNPKMDWRNSALKTINKPVDRPVSVADQENEQSADTSLRYIISNNLLVLHIDPI